MPLVQRAFWVGDDDWKALPPSLLLTRAVFLWTPSNVRGPRVLGFVGGGARDAAQAHLAPLEVDGGDVEALSVAREAKDAVGEGGEGALAALGFLRGNGGGGRRDEDEPPAVVLGVSLAGPLLGGDRVEVGPEGIAAARVGRTPGERSRMHGERDEERLRAEHHAGAEHDAAR